MVAEAHAASRNGVDVGRSCETVAVAAQAVGTLLVGTEDHETGTIHHGVWDSARYAPGVPAPMAIIVAGNPAPGPRGIGGWGSVRPVVIKQCSFCTVQRRGNSLSRPTIL